MKKRRRKKFLKRNALRKKRYPEKGKRLTILEQRAENWNESGGILDYRAHENRISFRFRCMVVTLFPYKDGNARLVVSDSTSQQPSPSFAVIEYPPLTAPQVLDTEEAVLCTWASTRLRIDRDSGLIHINVRHGNQQSDDQQSGAAEYIQTLRLLRNNEDFRVEMPLEDNDHIYGLGEKMGVLDKRGRTWQMWNTDESNHKPSADPLYQSIPFYLQFSPRRTIGVFLDSTAWSWFDMGDTNRDTAVVEARDDYLDLHLFFAPSPRHAITAYTALTGRMPLPPEWALGYQQCRYSYYPESRVREVAAAFREKSIPCDVIYLDIHYMNGFRVFTWDPNRFPEPEKLLSDLKNQGFRVVTIVDPGVKVDPDYPVYRDGTQIEAFCRFSNGQRYVGEVWPGDSVFPDFTREDVRAFWSEQHRELLGRGISGIWNDMNEPSDFTGTSKKRVGFTIPNTVMLDHDGHPKPFLRYHNAYGISMCRATRAAFPRFRKEERGFVLTRSGYAGVQRYAAVWTGDNVSWWEHLSVSIPMLLNIGVSGIPFAGGDVGGFQEDATATLFARWMATACFTPFLRAHTRFGSIDHEPWSFGDRIESICRTFIRLRYTLLPYLYTAFEYATRTGQPVMAPLLLEFPQDERCHRLNDEYLFGPSLLVAPITQPDKDRRVVYLPQGRWFDFFTDEFVDGPADIIAHAPLETIPLYVRGGSIVPTESARQHTSERGDGVLTLDIYPDAEGCATGFLYADEGEGFGYERGSRLKMSFQFEGTILKIRPLHAGFAPRWNSIKARLRRIDENGVSSVVVEEHNLDLREEREIRFA